MNTSETCKPQVDVRALQNDDLDAVIGGGIFSELSSAISSAVSEVTKSFGGALQATARN